MAFSSVTTTIRYFSKNWQPKSQFWILQRQQECIIQFLLPSHLLLKMHGWCPNEAHTCQLFLRYKREIFILGVLGFLKTTRSFPKIREEVRSLPKTSKVCRRRSFHLLFTSKIRDREEGILIYSFYTWFSLACERQTFLLAHRRWGTFHEEERLRLSDRNSILMTQNLSGIRSEALIGQRSSFIVLAIVYEWPADKRQKARKVKCKRN